jgi:hypothetical protein
VGHPGIKKMIELLGRSYHWLSLRQDIADYVRMCLPCQQTKTFLSKAIGLLQLFPPPKEPWEQVMADFIVQLPESQGYDMILVTANHHTKCAHFIPSVMAVSTEGSTQLFCDHVWKHHGWARKIVTD